MKQDYTNDRGKLDGVEAFLRVAERRSFTAAAKDLGLSPSAISQTIRALEQRVGVPLLMRTTRSVNLTEAGALFLAQAAPAFSGLDGAFEAARSLGGRPAGLLRINLIRSVIPFIIDPVLAGFCAAYPDVELELYAEDGLIDVTDRGFDAGIRLGEWLQADMVAVRMTDPYRIVTVATPDYVQKHGAPHSPADLARHQCVRWRSPRGAMVPWSFVSGNRSIDVTVRGSVILNDMPAAVAAVRTGAFMAQLAEPLVRDALHAGDMVEVLADYAPRGEGVFLYYPSRAQVMPKLRAFIDYVRAHAPALL
ncbi:MAG: LysR family transcriptional regulator [Sphingopyxis sp.]